MVKVYIKIYGTYTLTGRDFQQIRSDAMRRFIFTPDGKHTCIVVELEDGCIGIKNDSNTPFEFSLSRDSKLIAVVKYNGTDEHLLVNTNWCITQNAVENKVSKILFEWKQFDKNPIRMETILCFFFFRKLTPIRIYTFRMFYTSTPTLPTALAGWTSKSSAVDVRHA